MVERFLLEKVLEQAKEKRAERKKKYGNTYREESIEALKHFSLGKIDRWVVTRNHDDLIDLLVYIEFLLRRIGDDDNYEEHD